MGIFLKGARRSSIHGTSSPNGDPANRLRSLISSRPPLNYSASAGDVSSCGPVKSAEYEYAPVWNILPLYQLYELTFSKSVDPSQDDMGFDPPTYELSPTESSASDYFGTIPQAPQALVLRWENSILGNTHKLKRLNAFDATTADKIKIDITLTPSMGRKGFAQPVYNPATREFVQGDSIHGFVRVTNISDRPLPFDMLSVVFEGKVTVLGDDNKPAIFYKFLNMFDYSASWTPATWDTSETLEETDPVDGNRLQFSWSRVLEPGITYKKFFTFTLPDKLLDCACESHDLSGHCQLVPTLGLDKEQFLQDARRQREKPISTRKGAASFSISGSPAIESRSKLKPRIMVRDFCFPGTFISYSVEARAVGRLRKYVTPKSPTAEKEEFIILKDTSYPVRVVPHTPAVDVSNANLASAVYNNFVKTIKNSIDRGRALAEGSTVARERELAIKRSQLYQVESFDQALNHEREDQVHKVFLPVRKKALGQSLKILGFLTATTPRIVYEMEYVPPLIFLNAAPTTKNVLQIPVLYVFQGSDSATLPPDFRGFSAELAVCTLRTTKYPIPLELAEEMMFRNKVSQDGIENHVTHPFSLYLRELSGFVQKYGTDALELTSLTMMDVKSLANMHVKYNTFKIENCVPRPQSKWIKKDGKSELKTSAVVNLSGLFRREKSSLSDDLLAEAMCLVPSFQSCIVCRYYILTIYAKFSSGDAVPLKVRVNVGKL